MNYSLRLSFSGYRRTALQVACCAALLAACSPGTKPASPGAEAGRPITVVASTTILGDVVRQVAGEGVQVSVLVPPGSDPHSFQPAPRDLQIIENADLVFTNGAGLDTFIDLLIENALGPGEQDKVITVSDGIAFRQRSPGSQASREAGVHRDVEEVDPHVWFDPLNVSLWVDNIEGALNQIDPENAATYSSNGSAYRQQLEQLDAWIRDQIATIPAGSRKLVSDHENLGYFADRYGLELAGAVIPGSSAAAEPSADELAELIDRIASQGVKAIFVGSTVSPVLAERVAADTGVKVVPIFTDSLSPDGGSASSYLELMRYDVIAIVEALK